MLNVEFLMKGGGDFGRRGVLILTLLLISAFYLILGMVPAQD